MSIADTPTVARLRREYAQRTAWRLDLDWRWHRKELDYGCILSINPDAHSIRELDHMHWRVEMARKGGVPAERVLNAMPLPKLLRKLSHERPATGRAA